MRNSGIDPDRMLILETGVGATHVRQAIASLQGRSIARLISAGFCGALDPALSIGDVLVADEVLDQAGNHFPSAQLEGSSNEDSVVNPHSELGTPNSPRRLLTCSHLIATPSEKRSLGSRTGAHAVDMESAVWAAWCQAEGIPFTAIRVVSDTIGDALSPKLLAVLSRDRVRIMPLLGTIAKSPGLVVELVRLAQRTSRAAKQLAEELLRAQGVTRSAHRPGKLQSPGDTISA